MSVLIVLVRFWFVSWIKSARQSGFEFVQRSLLGVKLPFSETSENKEILHIAKLIR